MIVKEILIAMVYWPWHMFIRKSLFRSTRWILEVGFSFFSYHFGNGYHESWVNYMFWARSTYHYGWKVPWLDTYGGIPLGIWFSAHSYDNYAGYKGYSPVFPYLGLFLGTSYFFNDHIGLNGELGYNVTYANIGVIYKLR